MLGLQVAIPQRMGRRTHLLPMQVDCSLAKRSGQPNSLARSPNSAKARRSPRIFWPHPRCRHAELPAPLMTNYRRTDDRFRKIRK